MKTRDELYRAAVEWIARYDRPSLSKPMEIEGLQTVGLVADVFGELGFNVAHEVLKARNEGR